MANRLQQRLTAVVSVTGLVIAIVAIFGPGGSPAAAQARDKKKRAAEIANYVGQMTDRWNSWDLNADGVLDKDELAKAFRGKDAKAYDFADPAQGGAYKRKMSALTLPVALVSVPRPSLAANAVVAELVARRNAKKADKADDGAPAASPDVYQKYADYQFLILAGTKGESKVTKKEFDTWAKNYAKLLVDKEDAEIALQGANAKFAKAKTAPAKKQAEAETARHQQELNDALTQLGLIPASVQKAMNLKH